MLYAAASLTETASLSGWSGELSEKACFKLSFSAFFTLISSPTSFSSALTNKDYDADLELYIYYQIEQLEHCQRKGYIVCQVTCTSTKSAASGTSTKSAASGLLSVRGVRGVGDVVSLPVLCESNLWVE